MSRKVLPFMDRFEEPVTGTQVKRATCRSRKYGHKGDIVPIEFGGRFGGYVQFTEEPVLTPLGDVATMHYEAEGCEHPGDFIQVWNQIHWKNKYDPDVRKYLHWFEFLGDQPPVRWDTALKALVDEHGNRVSDAQASKARRMLALDLVVDRAGEAVETRHVDGGNRFTRPYTVKPLPSLKQDHEVLVIVVGAGVPVYRCDCQRARGTAKQPAGLCSHVLAVQAYRRARAEADRESIAVPGGRGRRSPRPLRGERRGLEPRHFEDRGAP